MKLLGYCENDDIVSQRIYNHWVGFNTFSVTISWSYFAVIIKNNNNNNNNNNSNNNNNNIFIYSG